MKKILLTLLLFSLLITFPGCGCNNEPMEEQEEPVDEIQENHIGPNSPPFSVGPSGPPPE
jgi:hypothetical protein